MFSDWYTRTLRRNSRMPGFFVKFYLFRLTKSLLAIYGIFLLGRMKIKIFEDSKFVIYNPNIKNLNYFKKHHNSQSVFLVPQQRTNVFIKNGLITLPIEPIFFLANLFGPLGLFPFRKFFTNKYIILNSDFGIDEISLVYICNYFNSTTICLQHGLYPFENSNDLDGIFCSQIIVKSQDQVEILRSVGYTKPIDVSHDLFQNYPEGNIVEWISNGFPIIFVGSGYLTNRFLRESYISLLIEVKNIFLHRKIIYRPHPREAKEIPREISDIFEVDYGNFSSLNNPSNYIYIGIKSTMLFEAAMSGRKVFIYESSNFPSYFKRGLLPTFNNLNDLAYEVNKIGQE